MIICSVDKTVPKYFHRRVCNSERILDSKGFPPPPPSLPQYWPSFVLSKPGECVAGGPGNGGCAKMWADQMTGAERSLVTVGRSLTVANGFPPAR